MEDYVRQRHIEEGFSYVSSPHISKDGLFHTSGHLPYYADTMYPPMELEGAKYQLKAMSCPMHNLIYQSRGRSYRELPLRLLRVRGRLPLREVRRRRRPDPGARHDPGRLPLLRHPRAGGRRGQAPAELLPRPVPRLRARRLLPRALDARRQEQGQVPGLRRGLGDRDRDPAAGRRSSPGSTSSPTPAARRSTDRRSRSRPRTRSAAPGRCRRCSTTSASPPGSAWSIVAADGSHQQPVMIHSAKFGSIERFIGVLVEHYAGAFPPWLSPVQVAGHPDRRATRRLPLGRRASRWPRADSGSRSTTPTTGCRRRSATRSCRRCRSW